MSDGRIRIDTKIDETGLDAGIGSVESKLRKLEKTTGRSAQSFVNLGLKMAGAAGAAKLVVSAIKDTTAAYRTQIEAETRLQQAAKNNPLLDARSVKALKDYASQLQSVTTYGDEELLGFMAQLASAGRSQAEIQKIISASVDIAASGTMSLESAMRNLNKTFGGLSGELGETIPEIKSLTEEQLKSGAAVDLMASRYKGMAEEVAKSTGSSQQLKAAMGDLKEELGAPFEQALGPLRRFFTELIAGWSEGLKKAREHREAVMEMFTANTGDALVEEDVIAAWEALYGKKAQSEAEKFFDLFTFGLYEVRGDANATAAVLADIEQNLNISADAIILMAEKYSLFTQETRNSFVEIKRLREQAQQSEREIAAQMKAEQDAAEAEEKAERDRVAAARKRAQDRVDFIKKVNDERDKAIEKIKLQAKVQGEEVDQLDIINEYAASYVQLISESGGLVRETDREAQALLKTTLDMSSELERQNELREKAKQLTEEEARALEEQKRKLEALRKEMQAALDAIQPDRTVAEQLQDQLDALDDLFAATEENEELRLELEEEYAEKRKLLAKQVADAKVAQQREETIRLLEIANQFASQYNEIMRSIQALAVQYIENDTKVKVEAVEDQYQAGEISAQEYEDRLTEINRKAAQERYKADMWAWSGNIASAVANTALGATKALAEGGAISGPILAAMIVAAGGAQLASIIAAKPIPPSFATGGIVGGTSYTGDKVVGMLNSKEMNLNAGQQRNLFDRINNDDLGGGSRVQVFNQASNDVRAEPQITEDGVRLMIRKTVAKDMADGRFNSSYRAMQNGLRGTRLTN